jgi:L-cysteine:1D-myo-inositol 2-amino-2-deoxy-alpha-D-glucopyranoside ligase
LQNAASQRGLQNVASQPGPPDPASEPGALAAAEGVLATVRERMADDLDAPGALVPIDRWAEQVTGALVLPPDARAAALLVRDAVDALLGVGL